MKKQDQEAARKLKKLAERLRLGFKVQGGYPAKQIAVFLGAVKKQHLNDLEGIRKEQEKRGKQAEELKKRSTPKPKEEHERKGRD